MSRDDTETGTRHDPFNTDGPSHVAVTGQAGSGRDEYVKRDGQAREHATDAASTVMASEQEAVTDGGVDAARIGLQPSGNHHAVTGLDAEHGAIAIDSDRVDATETVTPAREEGEEKP